MKRTSYFAGFKLYFWCCVGHHAQGALAAYLIILLAIPAAYVSALLLTAMYVAYQGFTRIRKQDAAGLDVLDYIVGFYIGAIQALAWLYFVGPITWAI